MSTENLQELAKRRQKNRAPHNMGIHMRYRIEEMLRAKRPVKEIAKAVGYCQATVYNEIKRGTVEQLTEDYETVFVYRADAGQRVYDEHMNNRAARDLAIGHDHELVNFVEEKIINDKWSPYACLSELKKLRPGKKLICLATLYNYIYRDDVFLHLKPAHLPNKGRGRYLADKDRVMAARAPAGRSIEERPREINLRKEFGHWELDSLMGSNDSQKAILVMTERKTRLCHMELVKDHTADSVVRMLNSLERQHKSDFPDIFKTITVDNGSEFADCEGMERSRRYKRRNRTRLYYCHPRVPEERGSNENMNKLLRRWIPKGVEMDTVDPAYIRYVQDWINNYPRRIFGGRTAMDMVREVFDVA